MKPTRRLALLSVTCLALVTGLTGCVPLACPAIGWSNALAVQLTGDTSAVTQVQLCTDGECAPTSEINPSGDLGQISLVSQVGDTWTFSTGMTDLEHVTVRTLGPDDTVLSETDVMPDWEAAADNGPCGGPASATVTLQV